MVAVALAVWLLDGLLSLGGWALPDTIGAPARVVLSLFAVWLAWRGFRWVSDRLLWRIRTKLIVSYLFIALVPVVLLTLFMAVAIVLLLGLTAASVVTGEIDRAGDVLHSTARSALAGLPAADADAVRALPARLAPAREVHPGVSWTLLRGGRVAASSGDAPRALPPWWKGPGFAGLVRLHPEEKLSAEALRAAWAEGDSALVLDAPADEAFYADLERRTGSTSSRGARWRWRPRGTASALRRGPGPGSCSWPFPRRRTGRPARRARSTGCRSPSSTSPARSCGGCRPSSCRATRAGGACRTS